VAKELMVLQAEIDELFSDCSQRCFGKNDLGQSRQIRYFINTVTEPVLKEKQVVKNEKDRATITDRTVTIFSVISKIYTLKRILTIGM
jgi:hypothetical protein